MQIEMEISLEMKNRSKIYQLISAALLLLTSFAAIADKPIDSIVAVVNEDVVLASELRMAMEETMQQLRASRTRIPPKNILQKQVLEHLIMKNLQLSIAKRTRINVDDEQVNQALQSIARNNKISVSQLKQELEREGMDYLQFREGIREKITLDYLRKRYVDQRVHVTEKEIQNYVMNQKSVGESAQEYKTAYILLEIPEAASSEQIEKAKEKADMVMQKIREGADFSEMAVSYSDGGNALDGGVIEARKANQLPTIFADIVPDMQVGDVSGIINSQGGYYIVKLLEITQGKAELVVQTKLRHILIKPSEFLTPNEAKRKLGALRERIINGEDFAELARSNSDDKGTASAGGEMDYMSPGVFVPEFQEQVDKLGVEEISPVFKSRFGFHIGQIIDRREHDDSEQVMRMKAVENIRQRKSQEAMQLWMRRMRDEAFVKIKL